MLRRHALAWLATAPTADGGDTYQHVVDDWHAAGRPFVVATPRGAAPALTFGLCRPRVDAGTPPVRIGAQASPDDVVRTEPPPSAAAVAARGADLGLDVTALRSLARSAEDEDLDVRIYGSWMWCWLTGTGGGAFVAERSDLDVVVTVDGEDDAVRALMLLAACQSSWPVRIDGELAFPDGGEVHWRELAAGAPDVLRKSLAGPALVARESLWS